LGHAIIIFVSGMFKYLKGIFIAIIQKDKTKKGERVSEKSTKT
jgi:hypothetical protein